MRVLLQSRATLFSVPGGDTVQIVKTAEALRRLGHQVDISIDLEPCLGGYDAVHLFNLTRPQELLLQMRNARRNGKKIVLSTIYVDYSEYENRARRGMMKVIGQLLSRSGREYVKTIARWVLNGEYHRGTRVYLAKGHRAALREILDTADILLPNSQHEMQRVMDHFPEARAKPYVVVPNAVDDTLFNGALPTGVESERRGVLCVARIEGRKNQLNVVKAMEGLPWHLTLVGKPAPNHMRFFEEIQRVAGSNVLLRGEVAHEDLPALYASAKVHVLASWMETTGLSSLEAGAMGCNLVITDKGDTREYFGEDVFYCQPDSVESIRDAIVKAHETSSQSALRQKIVREYTWQKAAEKTHEAYCLICS